MELPLKDWLSKLSEGAVLNDETFTVHSQRAERLGGIPSLTLTDVPLLLLADAVAGKADYFSIYGRHNCVFWWDRSMGPHLDLALTILDMHRIDYSLQQRDTDLTGEVQNTLVLPDLYRELLTPLFKRTKHAPLSLMIGDRIVRSHPTENGVWARRSEHARLILVDRGIDFEMPFAFPGWQIVARVSSLSGAPWPKQLVWNRELQNIICSLAQGFPAERM